MIQTVGASDSKYMDPDALLLFDWKQKQKQKQKILKKL